MAGKAPKTERLGKEEFPLGLKLTFPFTPQTTHLFSPKSCVFQTFFPWSSCGLLDEISGEKAEGKKIHSNTRARGHLRREIRLLLGEAQMESRSWEIDLFACCPHSPLGSSVTVSSVLIILSSWSTRLAWQRIELRSFFPAEMYCIHGLFVGDAVVGGEGASSGGWEPSGSWCPAHVTGISLQCLPTHGEEVSQENCARPPSLGVH